MLPSSRQLPLNGHEFMDVGLSETQESKGLNVNTSQRTCRHGHFLDSRRVETLTLMGYIRSDDIFRSVALHS